DDTVQRVIAPGLGPASEPVIDPAQARAAVVSAEPFDTGSGGPERFRIAAYAISGDRVAVIGLPLDKVDEASQQLVLALVAGALVLRDAASDAAATAPRRPITVAVTEPLVLDGDEHRLRQVVAAVVTNALVHTPASSAVVLRGVAPPGGGVVVEIADDGPG